MSHHPAIVGVGAVLAGERAREIEIAQRQALHEAVAAADATLAARSEVYITNAIDAYLKAMRREWKPEAIEISEGDYAVVRCNGREVTVGWDANGPCVTFVGMGDLPHRHTLAS